MDMIDLTSACQRTADLLAGVTDEQLALPTPCEKLRLDELIAHVGGLAEAFTAAARKDFGPLTDTPPVDGAQVDADWRTAYPHRLAELAARVAGFRCLAGHDPGRRDRPPRRGRRVPSRWPRSSSTAGTSRRRPVSPTTATRPPTQACLAHLAQFDTSGTEGMFGPAVPIADDAPDLDRIVAAERSGP